MTYGVLRRDLSPTLLDDLETLIWDEEREALAYLPRWVSE